MLNPTEFCGISLGRKRGLLRTFAVSKTGEAARARTLSRDLRGALEGIGFEHCMGFPAFWALHGIPRFHEVPARKVHP